MKPLIKKETIKKIEEEIKIKTTIPINLKEKIKKDVFTNIAIAILMIIYFTFLIAGSVGTTKTVRSIDFNIFSILLLGISIYLFEIAYKKNNGTLAIYGIETLLISIITLFFPYIIFELDEFYKKYYMIISVYIAIYYAIKSIWIVNKVKKIHIKQLSDIKEIVKKEKRKDITRKKEKTEEVDTENKLQKKQIKKINKNDNKNKQKELDIEKEKTQTTPKKRGRPRKVE